MRIYYVEIARADRTERRTVRAASARVAITKALYGLTDTRIIGSRISVTPGLRVEYEYRIIRYTGNGAEVETVVSTRKEAIQKRAELHFQHGGQVVFYVKRTEKS